MGGALLAWQQYRELVVLRATAMNKDERAAMQKRIWDLERHNKELNDQLAAARDGSGDAETMVADASGDRPGTDRQNGRNGPRNRGNPMQMMNTVRDLMAKPEVQALVNVQQKARIDAQYAALFKSLNLSSDQADKVKALLADRMTTMQDVFMAAREQGINPRTDPAGFQSLVANAQTDINNGLKAVLGDAGFNQMQNYDQTMPQRNVVNQLQQRLSYTDTPLTQAQADQLVQVLATNPAPPRTNADGTVAQGGNRGPGTFAGAVYAGGGPGGGGGIGEMLGGGGGNGATAAITPAAVSQAQSVLAPAQSAALQQLQQQQQAQQQLQQILRSTITSQFQNNNGGSGGANSGTKGKKGG